LTLLLLLILSSFPYVEAKTFSDSNYQVSIPDNWEVPGFQDNDFLASTPNKLLFLIISKNPYDGNKEKSMNEFKSYIKDHPPRFTVVDSGETIVAKQPTLWGLQTGYNPDKNRKWYMLEYLIHGPDYRYAILFSGWYDSLDDDKPILQEILDSFTLL